MAHSRSMIRQAVVDLLATPVASVYPTAVGASVFKSRVRALWPEEMPCICVYIRDDDAAVFNQSPIEYRREAQLVIEISAKLDDDLDDNLDAIAAEVESLMFLNETLKPAGWTHACWPELRLGNTNITLKGDNGDTQHGACIISFQCTYYQEAPEDISGTLDDFNTAAVGWNLENEQPDGDIAVDLHVLNLVFDYTFDSTFG